MWHERMSGRVANLPPQERPDHETSAACSSEPGGQAPQLPSKIQHQNWEHLRKIAISEHF